MDSKLVSIVAYCPKGIPAPQRVLYAMVPLGEVTMDIWLECLASRVQEMLNRKKWFKKRLANKVCKLLNRPPCDDLEIFGKYIIEYNSQLKNYITGSIDRRKRPLPFPIIVTENDEEVYKDMQVCDLLTWAGLLELLLSGRLGGYHVQMNYGLNKYYFANKDKFDVFK
jgi:hypothetical protein